MSIVSIVSMVKNEELFIEDAVKSILNQDVDLQLIIIDDHSTDNTLNILRNLEETHSNLKVLVNNKVGKVNAFLQGCSYATGSYMAFFAGDDLMPKGSLSQRVDQISSIKGPAVLLSKLRVLSDDKSINDMILPKKINQGSTSGAAIMIDREAAKYLLDIPSSLPNEDTWMELCIKYLSFLNIESHNVVACNWRVHSGNSNSIRQDFSVFSERFGLRMQAINFFYDKYQDILDDQAKNEIKGLMQCENYRKNGNFIGILFVSVNLSDKLRFIFYSNNFFFNIKKRIRSI